MKLTVFCPFVAALLLTGCGNQSKSVEITDVSKETAEAPLDLDMTSAQRFGYTAKTPEGSTPSGSNMPSSDGAAAPASSGLHWSAPEGWVQGPARSMREVTFFLDQAETAECYVTLLPGEAGGVAANLNRWCGQMGRDPLDENGLAALPRVACLGAEVPLLVLEGTYSGMGGTEQPDQLFAGIVAQHAGQAVFVKMVGPKAIAKAELDAFKAFCASLHDGRGHAHD